MTISYKNLWKLLIDKDMRKKDLKIASGLSHYTINKLNRSENVTTDVLAQICITLGYNIGDIMEVIPDGKEKLHITQ